MFYFIVFLRLSSFILFFCVGMWCSEKVQSQRKVVLPIFCAILAFFLSFFADIILISYKAKNMEARMNPQNRSPVAVVSEK